jgi:hypothetical protein
LKTNIASTALIVSWCNPRVPSVERRKKAETIGLIEKIRLHRARNHRKHSTDTNSRRYLSDCLHSGFAPHAQVYNSKPHVSTDKEAPALRAQVTPKTFLGSMFPMYAARTRGT